ncbi:hypothetical protein MBLNU230_g0630t1 [Neophaeotheca triangularis]
MDDLSGLTFDPSKPTTTTPSQANYNPTNTTYTSARSTPIPQQTRPYLQSQPQSTSNLHLPNNPQSRPSSTAPTTSKPSAPKATTNADSFGSLLNLNSQKRATNANLSIAERQRQAEEERQRQRVQQESLWEGLGSGNVSGSGSRVGTPGVGAAGPGGGSAGFGIGGGLASGSKEEEEEDILAAFDKAAPVDKASHFPPEAASVAGSRGGTPGFGRGMSMGMEVGSGPGGAVFEQEEEDDPFGLGAGPVRSNGTPAPQAQAVGDDDDDILGDLGRPVSTKPVQREPEPAKQRLDLTDPEAWGADPPAARQPSPPKDRGVAELVDMGFEPDMAALAIAETGGNTQAAVGWLLEQAHAEAKQKQQQGDGQNGRSSPRRTGSQGRRQGQAEGQPAWLRPEGRAGSGTRRQDSRSPANGEKDAAQMAQEMGSNFFKSANSLWKSSQKKMAKTLQEFQQAQEMDPNQPKWMRDASADSAPPAPSQRRQEKAPMPRQAQKPAADVTDEAAMLDMPRETAPPKPARSSTPRQQQQQQDLPSRGRSPADELSASARSSPQPRFMQQQPPPQDKRPATKLSKQEVDDQTAQAYVSPARRKRPTPKPEPQPEPEVDLFSSPAPTFTPAPSAQSQRPSKPASTPVTTPPKPPPRDIPTVSPTALANSAKQRAAGTEAFKRGDYGSALESYSAALSPLPSNHPVAIIIHSNRALTALKNGDSKAALADAEAALTLIGPSRGDNETIDLGTNEAPKEMKEFYSKALMRKAEALETVERYQEAAATWRQCVEHGVGGAISLRGRDRCDKAANPSTQQKPPTTAVKPKATAPARTPTSAAPTKPLGNSLQRPTLPSASSGQAVQRLRAANAAADAADDEKFALTESVEAKLAAWKGGKADNLRALLQSLDTVLWEGAGWKKVGMSDLVMPARVKIVYMKAIGRVHPDKVPQDATTEQKMVSAHVFSTLNEAWDKFKRDNNL